MPGLENGFTRIANKILEVVYKTKFNATQLKILMVIWRYTYGYRRKYHDISVSFLSEATGISKRYIKKELQKLIEINVIKVVQEATHTSSRIIGFNKYYDQWVVNNSSPGEQQSTTPGEEQFTTPGEQSITQERNTKEILNKKDSLSLYGSQNQQSTELSTPNQLIQKTMDEHNYSYVKAVGEIYKRIIREYGCSMQEARKMLFRGG